MKVHLNQVPEEGLHLEGEEPADYLDPIGQHFRALGPVKYNLDVGVSDAGLFATGSVAVECEVECVTCAEKFVYPLAIESFAMQTDLEGSETVDLTPYLREDILLALPPYPHCDWDGGRTCPAAHLARESAAPEPPAARPEVWGELDKLKDI